MTRSIHRAAAEGLLQAARFYRQEADVALPRRSVDEFERVARLLKQSAGVGTPPGDGRQSFPLVGLPYSIIFRHKGAGIYFVLAQYVNQGVDELDAAQLSPLLRLKYRALNEAFAELGQPDQVRQVFVGMQRHLYAERRRPDGPDDA